MRLTIVSPNRLIVRLRRFPLFRQTRFARPCRLVTSAQFRESQPPVSRSQFSAQDIAESYAQELQQMTHLTDCQQLHCNATRKRLRQIRNHSSVAMRNRMILTNSHATTN